MTEWQIPCNPKHYDIRGAFDKLDAVEWRQSTDIQVGDIVYIYITEPIKAIKYKARVSCVDLKERTIDDTAFVLDDTAVNISERYMRLEFLYQYRDGLLTYAALRENGLTSVRGPNRLPSETVSFIEVKEMQKK